MVGPRWRAGVGIECAGIPLVAAVVRRHGGERWPRHRPRAGNRPGNCPAAAHGGASVCSGAAGQRKARGARDRCGRTRYMALGSIRKRIQRLWSLLRASGPGRLPIGGNEMVGRPDFRDGRTDRTALRWLRSPPTASRAADQAASSFRFSRTIAENTGCARREGQRGHPTGVM